MSQSDEEVEKFNAYLAEYNPSKDNKSSPENKKDTKKPQPKNDDFNEYESDDMDPLENIEMDDRNW